MAESPQIKGFAIRGLLKFVKDSAYPGGIPAILEALPNEAKETFSESILSGSWYPYEVFSVLVATMAREMGGEDPDRLLHEIGRTAAGQDLRGVFKFITVILSVERIVRASATFWPRYCDTGALEVIEAGSGHFTVHLTGFPGIAPAHCRLIEGWIQGLGEGSGASDIAIEKTRCVHRGDPHCEYRGSWT